MRYFLEDIERCLHAGAFSTALASALLVPDACGAVAYPEITGHGRNRGRYVSWFDAYYGVEQVGPVQVDGGIFWCVRNGMIHETNVDLGGQIVERVIFFIRSTDTGSSRLGGSFTSTRGRSKPLLAFVHG